MQFFNINGKWVSHYNIARERQAEIDRNKPFCEFCSAKGPINHCKNCTRPKKDGQPIEEKHE